MLSLKFSNSKFAFSFEVGSLALYTSLLSFAAFALLNIFLLQNHSIVPTAIKQKATRPITEQTAAIITILSPDELDS